MNLLEFEAKKLLSKYDLPIPIGDVIKTSKLEIPFSPSIVKSQVPIGGRGKLGGVKFIPDSSSESLKIVNEIADLTIQKFKPDFLLFEEPLDIEHEFYLSLNINRVEKQIELVAHKNGGIEIESLDSDTFFRSFIQSSQIKIIAENLAEYFDLPEKSFILEDIIKNLFRSFTQQDMILLEINPLVLDKTGDFYLADSKVTLDPAAFFRHRSRNFHSKEQSSNLVILDNNGQVATLANGAGLAMSTVDYVIDSGFSVINFLDIGGSVTPETLLNFFLEISDFPNLKLIIINIFGGIVDCKIVAEAIIETKNKSPNLAKIAVRLSGNNSQEASEILQNYQIKTYSSLPELIKGIQ